MTENSDIHSYLEDENGAEGIRFQLGPEKQFVKQHFLGKNIAIRVKNSILIWKVTSGPNFGAHFMTLVKSCKLLFM